MQHQRKLFPLIQAYAFSTKHESITEITPVGEEIQIDYDRETGELVVSENYVTRIRVRPGTRKVVVLEDHTEHEDEILAMLDAFGQVLANPYRYL